METPYESICKPIEDWCLRNYYTDFLVTISIDGREETEYLAFNGDTVNFTWLNDWWEGEDNVRLLGFSPVHDVKIYNLLPPFNSNEVKWYMLSYDKEVEQLIKFAHFVAKEVVLEGDRWESNYMSFPELACRRLYKLGIIEKDGSRWYYEESEGMRNE